MAIRRTTIDRVNEARKSSIPTIGKGKPLDARGSEGDLTFRRTSEGLKLYIKANHKWHGIKVGESFDSLEKRINEMKSKVDTIKQFRLPSTYSVTGDFTLDVSGDIELNADGGQVAIKDSTADHFLFDCDNTALTIYDDTTTADYVRFQVDANGATTIGTNDNDGTAGHLRLQPDGDLILAPASEKIVINATHKLCFDGGVDTYIAESSADVLDIKVGNDMIFQITESGADGNTVDVDNACIGFTQIAATLGESTVIGGGGYDTDIDFRHSNKYYLEPLGLTIPNLNFIFPAVSGNFLLYTRSTGGWAVTNWKVYESDESAATVSSVMYPGGTAPTLTNSGYDVFSFYWDADRQRCFGVANAGFAL